MVKAHTPINWENEPSFNTPINETNLNKMDSTIGVLDDRIIEQETSKLDKATAYTMVKDISFNENNGVFTVTRLNGSTFTIDTRLEKIVINFDYNAETQQIEIILIDGTKQYIDISSLISPIDFVDSDTIGWEVTSDWKVKAKVLDGSITEDMLQPNYLAEIKVEAEKSAQSMANAKISENNAKQSELNAKESEEKALEYSNNAQPLAQSVSGNNPTAINSTDGSIIYLNDAGYTEQKTLSGKNLIAINKTSTNSGVTQTLNEDGSINIKGTSTAIGQLEVIGSCKLPSGTYYISVGADVELPATLLQFKGNGNALSENEAVTLTEETSIICYMGLYQDIGTTYNYSNIKIQIEKGSEFTGFEKYCGGIASPNPDYPQHIDGLADKGYFDGELKQGMWDTTNNGSFLTASTWVCNANKVYCKTGDVVKITHEEVVDRIVINSYDVNNNQLDYVYADSVSELEYTIPSNAVYCNFMFKNENGITPSTAKHICVTINGMYAVRVKTGNKNLFAFGKTAIDKTSEYRANAGQRILMSSIDGNPNSIRCKYNGGSYSFGYFVIEGIDGTQKYKISYTISKNTTSHTPRIIKDTTHSNENQLAYMVDGGNNATVVSSSNYFVLSDIQVEQGEVATPFQPHQSSQALIPVSAPLYDGDYIEVYADGTGREYRVMQAYKLTSADADSLQIATGTYPGSVYSGSFLTNKGFKNTTVGMKCNFLNVVTSVNDFKYGTAYKGSSFNMWLKDGVTFVDKTELATFLDENEIILVGELATPTSTPLTKEQVAEFMKLQTFKGVTHVTADGEVVIRYYCDNASGETAAMLQKMIQGIS